MRQKFETITPGGQTCMLKYLKTLTFDEIESHHVIMRANCDHPKAHARVSVYVCVCMRACVRVCGKKCISCQRVYNLERPDTVPPTATRTHARTSRTACMQLYTSHMSGIRLRFTCASVSPWLVASEICVSVCVHARRYEDEDACGQNIRKSGSHGLSLA